MTHPLSNGELDGANLETPLSLSLSSPGQNGIGESVPPDVGGKCLYFCFCFTFLVSISFLKAN